MKIDLTQIMVKPTIQAEPVRHDFSKEIAEIIYHNSRSLAETSFALKLYEGKPLEASEEEVQFVRNAADNFFFWAKEPILNSLNAE